MFLFFYFLELQAMVKKVLEESDSNSSQLSSSPATLIPQWPNPEPGDTLFRSATSRIFCGQARNDSPFGINPCVY